MAQGEGGSKSRKLKAEMGRGKFGQGWVKRGSLRADLDFWAYGFDFNCGLRNRCNAITLCYPTGSKARLEGEGGLGGYPIFWGVVGRKSGKLK